MSACRLVLVLISFVLLQTICEAGLLPAKRTINITNDVYIHSGLDLTVHCKSGDDDLGEHVLPFKGWYSFRFRPWTNSLFHCIFAWQNQIKSDSNPTAAAREGFKREIEGFERSRERERERERERDREIGIQEIERERERLEIRCSDLVEMKIFVFGDGGRTANRTKPCPRLNNMAKVHKASLDALKTCG
ncbi:hypothetical protein Dsin_021435 [Dipteronia sinensis]|uniref:S-protein homolog n=1 Tax=Dipteronia sinensis TaxID=43782 RepID=A0AAE0A053_9ROSI|nr:hypothetical protein Dsin_021435 [Dipteronia sinensis]